MSTNIDHQAPYSINLPPQYQRQYENAVQWPDPTQVRMPFESISDNQAVRIVRHDYETAANYRYQNHDWRWVIADSLYTGWKTAKYWEGTKVPRSNMPVMVAFEQVESLMPRVMQGLFSEPDWFESAGRGRTSPKAARVVREVILSQLNESNPREVCRRVVKSGIMYGNGIMMVGWNYEARRSLQFIPQFTPKLRRSLNPIDNVMQSVPTSGFNRRIVEKVVEDYVNRPIWQYIPLKQFYVDPNCPSPLPSESRYVIYEVYMAVDDLDALRSQPGFESMPDKFTLWKLSHQNIYTQADTTMSEQESVRRSSWSPHIDQSSDPAAARVKVIRYFTKDRIMWSLNNQFIVYNKPHPIGRITFHDAFYADLLDRFYAMAITDIVEPEQRAQEGLLNARFDELSLILHPTTVKQRNSGTPMYQVRVRPGAVAESSDPKNDIIRQYPPNATAAAHLETQASELRVQKNTGVTDLAMAGVGSSTNPAARTATGAGIQGQAAAARVIYLVENIEYAMIEPALNDTHEYNQRFLDPNQMIEAVAGEDIDPIAVFGAKVKFEMRASAKMQSRQALISLMPMTLQAMMNPQLLAQLAAMGQTVDFVEMMQMFMDASGYRRKFTWVRPMTDAEKQAMASQKPDQNEADMMLQTARLDQLKDMQVSKQEMEILRDLLKTKLESQLMPKAGPKSRSTTNGSQTQN